MPGNFPFDPRFQFPRVTIREAIIRWAISNASSSYPVASLIAPPGAGKSWVLEDLFSLLSTQPPPLVFLVKAREIIDSQSSIRRPAFKYPAIHQWLTDCYITVHNRFANAPDYDPVLDISQAITVLVEWLLGAGGAPRILALVDGYDEISDAHQDYLSDRVLVPFITGGNQVRMLIAHRDPGCLHNDILRSLQKKVFDLERIDPLSDAFQQFEKVQTANCPDITITADSFQAWAAQLKNYRWNNPYINRYLFEIALAECGDILPQLTKNKLKECVHALLERPFPIPPGGTRYPVLPDKDFLLLQKFTGLSKEFTADEVEQNIGVTWLDSLIFLLMNDYGVLLPVKSTLRYYLIESLRSLLLDIK